MEEAFRRRFWKVGDTVVVRMEAIDYEVFEVLRDFENSGQLGQSTRCLRLLLTVDGVWAGSRRTPGLPTPWLRALNGPNPTRNALYFQPKLNAWFLT